MKIEYSSTLGYPSGPAQHTGDLINLSNEDLIGLDQNTSRNRSGNTAEQGIDYKKVQVIYGIVEQARSFFFDKYFISNFLMIIHIPMCS